MSRVRRRPSRFLFCLLALALVVSTTPAQLFAAEAVSVVPDPIVSSETTAGSPSEPAVVRELVEKRTATSKTFLLSNDDTRVEYHGNPIHYRDARTGRFEPIDATLVDAVVDGEPVVVNKANRFKVRLPKNLDEDDVTIEASGCAIALRPAERVRAGEAVAATDAVTWQSEGSRRGEYDDAFAGADLTYESRPQGLKETIVLDRAPTSSAWPFDLTLSGLSPRLEPDGSISLLRPGTTTCEFTIPRPYMMDSSGASDGADYSDAVRYELTGTAPDYRLVVIADAAWLADAARVYPVMVDPTIDTSSGEGDDTFVSSANQTTNYLSHPAVWVNTDSWLEYGLYQPGSTLNADMATKKTAGHRVVRARLDLYAYDIPNAGDVVGYMCATSTPVYLSGVTWNSRPSNVATLATDALTISSVSGKTFDVTGMVAYWQSLGLPYNYTTLRLHPMSTTDAHIAFRSDNYATNKPLWRIDYSSVPTVTLTSPSAGPVSTLPDAVWTYSDEHTHTQAAYEVQLATSTASPAIASTSGEGAATSTALPVPAGGFVPGETYVVRVRAASSPSVATPRLWSGWSEWGSFTYNVTDAVGDVTVATTASMGWFAEADGDSDGVNDAMNDSATQGRGSVALSWSAARGAAGYAIEIFDGNEYREVATTTATTWTSAGPGLMPADTQIAALSPDTTSSPFVSGTGLDLRDDPRPLYAKTAGTSMDATASYLIRVTPLRSGFSAPESHRATSLVTLENRTTHLRDDPRHTEHSLGEIGQDSAVAVLDEAAITLAATDLEIATWGPGAALSRHYSSNVTATGLFAPGWRFDFERCLQITADTVTYIDETGESRVFARAGDTATIAPSGRIDTLTRDLGDWLTPETWTLASKGGLTTTFDADGLLLWQSDRSGNEVSYTRSGEDLTITAANDQEIAVDVEDGTIASATWSTTDGTRTVVYGRGGDSASVTRYAGSDCAATTTYHYTDDRITSVEGPNTGSTWTLAYGSAGTTMSVENVSGASTPAMRRDISIDPASRTATITTFDGATTYAWNPTGTTAVRSAEGSTALLTTLAYDAANVTMRECGPTGKVTSRIHDLRGNVVSSTDEAGRQTSYAYDEHDDCIAETAPSGSITQRTYDAAGNVTLETKMLSVSGATSRTERTYDTSGRMTQERSLISTTPAQAWVETEYSGFADSGEPQTTISRDVLLEDGGTPIDITTTSDIDAFGNAVSATDGEGVQASTDTFDAAGRTIESVDASGVITHTRYDAAGNTTESWRSHEVTTSPVDWRLSEYNGAGLVATETVKDSGGTVVSTITHAYDALGREVALDDSAVPGVAATTFDARGNTVVAFEEGAGPAQASSRRSAFDAEDNEVLMLEPGATSWASATAYAAGGQVTLEEHPDGSKAHYAYEADGDLASESSPTDEGTATTSFAYDLDGKATGQTDADGSQLAHTYDLLGRQTGAQIAGQPVTTTSYNALGWVLSETDFDGVVKTKSHDRCGRVVSETTGGRTTMHAYDDCGREASVGNPDGSGVSYVFDLFGRVLEEVHTATDGSEAHRIRTTNDEAGRLSSVVDSTTALTRTYAYAPDGAVTLTESRAGRSSRTIADGTGLMRSVAATLAGLPIGWSVTATDAAGRVTGWSSQQLNANVELSYDQAGRPFLAEQVAPWETTVPGGGGIAPQGLPADGRAYESPYRYDPDTGKKSGESFGFDFGARAEEATYTYTIDDRLAYASCNASSTTYDLDPGSGALAAYRRSGQSTVTLSYDATGNLESAGGRYFAHDGSGRRSNAGPAVGSMESTYTWTGERLARLTTTSGLDARYAYDGSGQRVRSTVRDGSLTTTTTWHYDGISLSGLAAQRSDGATWSVEYLRDEKGVPFAGVYAATDTVTPFLMVTTDRGDVRELLDTEHNAFAFYAYDAYGNPTVTSSAATGGVSATTASRIATRQPLRYAGYCWDAYSKLYYCSQRYYDPSVAAFISKDPARADGEESAYQYCGGEPVGEVDPTGECPHYSRLALDFYEEITGKTRYYHKSDITVQTRDPWCPDCSPNDSARTGSKMDFFAELWLDGSGCEGDKYKGVRRLKGNKTSSTHWDNKGKGWYYFKFDNDDGEHQVFVNYPKVTMSSHND